MGLTKSKDRRSWRAALTIVALLSLPLASSALAEDFTNAVFFGDSLSDPGNHFIAFGTTSHQPFVPIPDASYAIGGHHFTDGKTWAEQLATTLKLPNAGHPALRAPGVFTNYAVGRARARAGAPVFPFFDLSTQVGRFLADFGGRASSTDLFVVWIGADDLDDALTALASDPSGATSIGIIQAAIAAVGGNIQALWAAGARTFLIPNLPNLALTPAVRALGPDAQFAATQLTAVYNGAFDQALSELLTALQQEQPDTRFIRLDVNGLFAKIVLAPGGTDLADVTDSCLTFGVIGNAICSTPKRFLFWDGIHPTTEGHSLIEQAAFLTLGSP